MKSLQGGKWFGLKKYKVGLNEDEMPSLRWILGNGTSNGYGKGMNYM